MQELFEINLVLLINRVYLRQKLSFTGKLVLMDRWIKILMKNFDVTEKEGWLLPCSWEKRSKGLDLVSLKQMWKLVLN